MTKHSGIVIGIAVLVSAGIWLHALQQRDSQVPPLSSRLFQTADGWGYDILVNDTVFIHQDCYPGATGKKTIPSSAEAKQLADRLIYRLQRGKRPETASLSR